MDGDAVGTVGIAVGRIDGLLGRCVGNKVGKIVGNVGLAVGIVGAKLGEAEGEFVGVNEGS